MGKIIMIIVIFCLSFFIGAIGFPQLIGSLQSISSRGMKMTLVTIIIWLIILGAFAILVFTFLPVYKMPMYIGLGISLLMSFGAGKIE